jgi:hypothetical protein
MRRWLIAAIALLVGGGVSATLLVLTSPDRGTSEVYAAARDVQAGEALVPGSLTLVRVDAPGAREGLFTRGEEQRLEGLRATHDLLANQLIQRGDVSGSSSSADRRLVFVPIKDVPPSPAGSRVDLLVVDDTPGRVSVAPFALDVDVRAIVAGGLIVVVSSEQAPAFVYAASAMHLTAVIAEPGAAGGGEGAIASADQALAVAGQR